jgi:hypothetical protein
MVIAREGLMTGGDKTFIPVVEAIFAVVDMDPLQDGALGVMVEVVMVVVVVVAAAVTVEVFTTGAVAGVVMDTVVEVLSVTVKGINLVVAAMALRRILWAIMEMNVPIQGLSRNFFIRMKPKLLELTSTR